MDSDRCEDSGEMYSSHKQGEYMPLDGTPRFSMQGLSDALADLGEGINEPPAEEYAMMLEVTMADCPGRPRPPAFSSQSLGSWSMCRWMAQVLPICSSMISRAIGVWVRIPCMRSVLTWRRLFQSGSRILLTLLLASYLWWKPGGELSLPPIAEG